MNINKLNVSTSPQEWANLLRDAVNKKSHYIGKEGEGIYAKIPDRKEKLSVAEIGEISQKQFKKAIDDAKLSIDETLKQKKYLTNTQVRNLTRVGSDIVGYTEAIIKARKAKRDRPLNRIGRGIALVLAAIASIPLIGIPFLIKLIGDDQKFADQIQEMRKQILAMIKELDEIQDQKSAMDMKLLKEEMDCTPEDAEQLLSLSHIPFINIDHWHELVAKRNELKNKPTFEGKDKEALADLEKQLSDIKQQLDDFKADIEMNKEKLALSFTSAAYYTNLKKEVHDRLLGHLNSPAYSDQVTNILTGDFNETLEKYFKIEPAKRADGVEQFKKDIPRGTKFKRIDPESKIRDENPIPLPEVKRPLSLAKDAINELIKTPQDQDWQPLLQAAVTQTNLNAAFLLPRTELLQLSTPVTWENHRLLPNFPGKLPPIELEITRDSNGNIQETKVSVKGRLNLVKEAEQKTNSNPQVIIEGAIETTLSYTLTLQKGVVIVNNLNIQNTTNIPSI